MKQTDQTLLEQMRITDIDIDYRKELLSFSDKDCSLLVGFRAHLEDKINDLVAKFYEAQTSVAEIALVIGDADTLRRLQGSQRRYVLDLFSGTYDLEYVNNRLRIGLVHKRMGVEPKLYLAAIRTLKSLLVDVILESDKSEKDQHALLSAIDKLLWFDITLVFETYIRSLVSEIEISKNKSDLYAIELEEKVKHRTEQLEKMTRIDSLTGLLSVRYLKEVLARAIRFAKRRSEPLSVVYLDVNNFKDINDNEGHQKGDEILRGLGECINKISRTEDNCFRYGGDEFCLILPNCIESKAREIYINRLNKEINEKMDGLTISAGVAQAGPEQYDGPETLIRMADEDMFAAKKNKPKVTNINSSG